MPIRIAEPTDAAALLCIYQAYIDTPITFEAAIPTEAEFAERIADITRHYPYLVCEEQGQILGYAYAHRFRERAAYQWSAELSVYVKMGHHKEGIGKRLCNAVIELLRLQGVQMLYSGVTVPNPASEGLHTSLGFVEVGTYHRAGFKCNQWQDVKWYEKQLGDVQTPPSSYISFTELPNECVQKLLYETT